VTWDQSRVSSGRSETNGSRPAEAARRGPRPLVRRAGLAPSHTARKGRGMALQTRRKEGRALLDAWHRSRGRWWLGILSWRGG
jgi:hypothetical protein